MSRRGVRYWWLTDDRNAQSVNYAVQAAVRRRRNVAAVLAWDRDQKWLDFSATQGDDARRVTTEDATATIHAGRTADPAPSHIPLFGQLLLCAIIRPEHQKERLGCFTELFTEWERKFGIRTARRLYYFQALRSMGAIIKIGVAAVLSDRIWHWISSKL